MPGVNCWGMTMTVEKISAVTFRVSQMRASVQSRRGWSENREIDSDTGRRSDGVLQGRIEAWCDSNHWGWADFRGLFFGQ